MSKKILIKGLKSYKKKVNALSAFSINFFLDKVCKTLLNLNFIQSELRYFTLSHFAPCAPVKDCGQINSSRFDEIVFKAVNSISYNNLVTTICCKKEL